MDTIPESHKDLLTTDVGMLGTFGHDGYPQVTALWFLLDDDVPANDSAVREQAAE